jgi:alkylation response protein AidB-like acyl-CoA dehydrogenase
VTTKPGTYDRDATFPLENYGDLKSNGLLGICIPTGYGGLGAGYATYALVSDRERAVRTAGHR